MNSTNVTSEGKIGSEEITKWKPTNWDWFSLILPLISISPLLYLQATILWSKQHLQFFPLAILAAAWFIRAEGIPFLGLSKARANASLLLCILGLLCCCGGILLYSSWLAHVASIVLVFAWCLGKFANLSVLRILGICGLIAVALPPPNNGDKLVVQLLQSLSTNVSSLLMDITHILHVPKGNVIDIDSKSLFVEEACSGVDSQYALMAVAGTLLLVGRAGLFVSIITIVTVPLWAILGNLLRIYSIVLGIEYFGIDLSAGTVHTILGLATFSLAAWAHWSSVQFLNWISMIPSNSGLASGQSDLPKEKVMNDSVGMETVSDLLPRWIIVFPGLLLFATPVLIATAFASQLPALSLPKLLPEVASILPSKGDFPILSNEAVHVSFMTQDRSRDDLMGQHSCIWSFSTRETQETASLDLPFRSWHPLWVCYQLTGWKDLGRTLVEVSNTGDKLDWPFYVVRLENPNGEFAILHFSHFTKNGEPFIYSQSNVQADGDGRNTRWILPTILKQLSQMQEREPVTFQFQLLSRTSEPATEEQIVKFRDLFLEAREKIREKSIPAFRKFMGEE